MIVITGHRAQQKKKTNHIIVFLLFNQCFENYCVGPIAVTGHKAQ